MGRILRHFWSVEMRDKIAINEKTRAERKRVAIVNQCIENTKDNLKVYYSITPENFRN